MKTILCTKRLLSSVVMNRTKEITIPVPWGKISGKWWGSIYCKPILCFHGLRDNCGSFDKILPLLCEKKNISFLAIDLPGHGFSTPFPRGMIYNFMNYIILVQLIYEYFNFSKLSFLGHSLGAMISFVSTILFPEKVDFVICIDALQPLQSDVSKESVKKSVNDFIRYNKFTKEAPSYTFQEILEKMDDAYKQSLDIDSIMCLLERNIAASKDFPGKYHFTVDPMLKVRTMFNWTQEQILKDVSNINNPIFICEAKQSYARKYRKRFYEIVDVLRKCSKDCAFHTINGPHHLHLSESNEVAPLINAFLEKHYTAETINLKDLPLFSSSPPNLLKH